MTLAIGCKRINTLKAPAGTVRGFSLLELLIVMVVMGVLMSIVSLSFTTFDDDPAEKGIERLRFNVEMLMNEAIVRSEPLALGFAEQGYAFYQEDDGGKWVAMKGDQMLKPQPLGKELQAALFIEEEKVALSAELDTDAEPQVFIYPTGEITPFVFELQRKDQEMERVVFDGMGQVVKHEEKN